MHGAILPSFTLILRFYDEPFYRIYTSKRVNTCQLATMSVLSPAPLAELIRSAKFRVRPEKWTQTHLDLVGCRFEDAELGQVNTSSHNEQLSSASRASQEPSNFLDDRDDEDQQLRNRHLIVRLQHSRAELKLQLMEQLLLTDGESLFSFVL